MPDERISVIDLATHHGIRKQTIFKVLKRLGIEPTKRRGANNRGQIIAYLTQAEARKVVEAIQSTGSSSQCGEVDSATVSDALLAEQGVFYLLSLEPKSDPGRFKVGFATSLSERLRQLRCSAPFTTVVATWPCKRLWERTAIDSVGEGCERLHTEVFRTTSLEAVRERCDRFFALMPKIAEPGAPPNGGPATRLGNSGVAEGPPSVS